MTMRHLDLFSGIGGFALAASRVWGIEHEIIAFCEIDMFCRKVLQKNFPSVFIHDNIKTFNTKVYYGTVDVLTAGFPCQPYSFAGQRRGSKDNRSLWHEAFRVINETRPNWVVAENVAGIVNMELDHVLASLEDSAYTVQTYNIPACSVNAPHRRQRVWIVATNSDSQRQQQQEGFISKVKQRTFNSDSLFSNEDRDWSKTWCQVAARFCRMDDGLSAWIYRHRQQRLRALGNAIVPQVAEQIFYAIQSQIKQDNA